jgi:hypothetical protein
MKETKIQHQSYNDIPKGDKPLYQPPKVLASYGKDELESALQPEGQSGGGCGCGCGGGAIP